MLELVAADDAVPELVSHLVHRDALRVRHAVRREPPRPCRDQRRILHPAGAAPPRWVDDGDVFVRIRAVPLAVVRQRRARRLEMAVGLPRMLGLQEQPHLHVRQRGMLESLRQVQVVRARRPGEIVHIFLVVVVGGRAVAVVARLVAEAGCADDPSGRGRDADVVDAVIGEEFGRGVELMAVPAGVFEDADLGEPLREEEEVADGAGPREGAGDFRGPFEQDVDDLARIDLPKERHGQHCLIVRIAIRRDVAHVARQVDRRGVAGGAEQAY